MVMEDNLPVHVILGAADIKTTEPAVLGVDPDIDPGAEHTMLGWVIMGKLTSLSTETEKDFFQNSSQHEFEQMCSQEVLGPTDKADVQQLFHEDFKDHLQHLDDGTYSSWLPWKPDHPLCLQTNNWLLEG